MYKHNVYIGPKYLQFGYNLIFTVFYDETINSFSLHRGTESFRNFTSQGKNTSAEEHSGDLSVPKSTPSDSESIVDTIHSKESVLTKTSAANSNIDTPDSSEDQNRSVSVGDSKEVRKNDDSHSSSVPKNPSNIRSSSVEDGNVSSNTSQSTSEEDMKKKSRSQSNSEEDMKKKNPSIIPTQVGKEGEVAKIPTLQDELISYESTQVLQLFLSSSELAKVIDSRYLFEKMRLGKYVIPDSKFGHFKIKENAAEMIKMSTNITQNQTNWKYLYDNYINAIQMAAVDYVPITESYLNALGRKLAHSPKVQALPSWGLAPAKQYLIAHILYGVAHGANDLVMFLDSKYSKLSLTYKYSSTMGEKDRSHTILELHGNGAHSGKKFESIFKDKAYNTTVVRGKPKVEERYSIYFADSYKSIITDLYEISNEASDLDTSQSSLTFRSAIMLKSVTEAKMEAMADGFTVQLTVNEDFQLHVTDKSVIDSLLALFYIEDIILDDDKSERRSQIILNYIGTGLHKYIIDQMAIKEGVVLHTIDMKLVISRKPGYDNISTMHGVYKKMIQEGHIVPITTLQHLYYFKKNILQEWKQYIVWSAISNPSINPEVLAFRPSLSIESKHLIRDLSYMKDFMLTSDHYLTPLTPPTQQNEPYHIEYDRVILELLVRNIVKDDIPDYYPIFTRAGWVGSSGKSPDIKRSSYHPIMKFSLKQFYKHMNSFLSHVLLDNTLYNIPPYIRGSTMLCNHYPDIIYNLVSYDNERLDFLTADLKDNRSLIGHSENEPTTDIQ